LVKLCQEEDNQEKDKLKR